MPTAIDPRHRRLSRRGLLAGTAAFIGAGLCLRAGAAPVVPTASALHIVAAWSDATGHHHIGLIALKDAKAEGAQVLRSLPLPSRPHGLACLPDGTVLAVARRPGEWLLRWHPFGGTAGRRDAAQWLWADGDRRFSGHVTTPADGSSCYTTEVAGEDGQGWLVRRHSASLEVLEAWPTGGADPHDMEWLADGSLLVANGGIQALPETGRAKLSLARMNASLVQMHPNSGEVRGQWRLADPRLSIRHLCRRPNGSVGVALQAEHDEPAARAAAPLLALFDPRAPGLMPMAVVNAVSGYAANIATAGGAWLLSCPREHRVQLLDAQGHLDHELALPSACAVVADASSGAAWVLGGNMARRHDGGPTVRVLDRGGQFDNHAVAWPAGARVS